MLYLTGADAVISVFDDKAHWSFWRPIAAIREAGTDDNPDTVPDPGWLPLVNTPPYPDHPSGASGFSGALTATLQDFFGTDRVALSDTSAGLPPRTRSWTSFSSIADEVVLARMWLGIHFLNPDEQGREMGEAVAKYREKHYFGAIRGARSEGDD